MVRFTVFWSCWPRCSRRFRRGDGAIRRWPRRAPVGRGLGRIDGAQSVARLAPAAGPARLAAAAGRRGPGYGCRQPECPYFESDPRLDPRGVAASGLALRRGVGHHGEPRRRPAGTTTLSNRQSRSPSTWRMCRWPRSIGPFLPALNWAIGSRRGLGNWTLPIGFCWRRGPARRRKARAASPDADGRLTSHLHINVGDVDYASNETSLGPDWRMKWRIGLRTADIFFNSQADEPLAAAAAGSGIFERSISNNFWGIGPHAGWN